MKKRYVIAIMATGLLFAQCTAKKATTSSTTTTTTTTTTVKKSYTTEELAQGKVIWQTSCIKCHKLYDAGEYTVAKWENILPRMIKRSKLTDEDGGKVHAYLIANAKSN